MITYSALKSLIAQKNLAWQYEDQNNRWAIYATDGITRHECELFKDPTQLDGLSGQALTDYEADLAEWTATYKPVSNYASGIRQNPFATPDFDFAGDGAFETCLAGQTKQLNFVLTEDLYIDGGVIVLEGSVLGDWIKVEVVHPVYGVVKIYVKKRYVPASPVGSSSPVMEIKTPYAGKVFAGLTLRTTYNSTGVVDVKFAVNLDLHRALTV